MKKTSFLGKSTLIKIAAIQLFFFVTVTLTFSQELKNNTFDIQNEWWYPLLIKHNVNPSGYNNFKNIFEMGETNSIVDGVCTLTNAFMIIKDSVDNYMIIESPLIIHDLNNEIIKANSDTIRRFKKDSNPSEPYEEWQIEKMELHAIKN